MSSRATLIVALAAGVLAGGGAATAWLARGPAGAPALPAPAGIVDMDPFLVNLRDGTGERFARVRVQLTVTPKPVAARIEQDRVLSATMRDRVLTMLSAKSVEELMDPLGKEGLRREIKANLGVLLDEAEVQDVLFADFVVQ